MAAQSTPVSSILLVMFASFIGSFGAVFLKSGATRLQGTVGSMLLNHRLGFGVLLYGLSSVFFLLGVRRGELSVLYPMASLGYIWTLIWSRLFFQEALTRNKLLGLFLILFGIAFLGIGNR